MAKRLIEAFFQIAKSRIYYGHGLMVWPLIIAGGRLVFRMVLNVWDMIES